MKILIVYFSQTGNTERIASAIRDEVERIGHEAHLSAVANTQPEDFADYGLAFLGSTCHDSDVARPVLTILEAILASPSLKMAGFATHAAPRPEGGQRNMEFYELWAAGCERTFRQASQDKGFELVGYLSCQGAPSPPIEAFIHREILPDEQEFAQYLQEARKHPTADDLEQARGFARAMLSESLRHAGSSVLIGR